MDTQRADEMNELKSFKPTFQVLLKTNEDGAAQWYFLDGNDNPIGTPEKPVEYSVVWQAQKLLLDTLCYWNKIMMPIKKTESD